MFVTFDFHADDGAVQRVDVPDCDPDLYQLLVDCEAGRVQAAEGMRNVLEFECRPEGASYGTWLFNPDRVRNVRHL